MSTPWMPNGTMPDMKQIEEMTKAYRAAMPPELAGAVNLLAHPVAGAAAAGALGIGLASHAFGMWLGAVAGAAEASQKLLAATLEGEAPKHGARLDGIAHISAQRAAAAAMRTALADAQTVVRDVAEVASEAAEAMLADTAAALVPPAEDEPAGDGDGPGASRPAGLERPAAPDDLKAISGVGPKAEKVLNDLGIWTHAQIAALTEAEIAWLDGELGFGGRIGRDDWIGQAKALARA